jgi:hypothetical protein
VAQGLTPAAPLSGFAAWIGGELVAAGRASWASLTAGDETLTIDDGGSGLGVEVPLAKAVVTSSTTTGWLFGRRVFVVSGADGGLTVSGAVVRGGTPPPGATRVDEDGSYTLEVEHGADSVAGMRTVTDTFVGWFAGGGGADDLGAWTAGHPHGGTDKVRLASLETVPLLARGGATLAGPQTADGVVLPPDAVSGRRWLHGRSRSAGEPVELWAQAGAQLWAAARRRGKLAGRDVAVGRPEGGGFVRAAWVPADGVEAGIVLSRHVPSVEAEQPLLHGRYVRVNGLWRSTVATDGAGGGARGAASTVDLRAETPVPIDTAEYRWSLDCGVRSVPDSLVTASTEVRTRAVVAGLDVELARPYDPMVSENATVRGAGRVPDPLLLADGSVVTPGKSDGGGWVADVRRDLLTEIRVESIVDG